MIHGINSDSSIQPSLSLLQSKESNDTSWLDFPWLSASPNTVRMETPLLRRMAWSDVVHQRLLSFSILHQAVRLRTARKPLLVSCRLFRP